MRLGIAPPNYAAWFDATQAVAIATEAEATGFDSIWLGDHVAIPADQADIFGNAYLDCFTVMGFLAASTNLRLGTHVAVVPYRHPIVTAKIVASLDVLSNGRIVLGVGSGHVPGEAAALNTSYAERGAMTDEYLEVMTALWSQDVVSYHGKWIDFDDLCPMTRPVQQPMNLVVGGSGRKSMRRALRFGAGWTPMASTPELLRPQMAELARLAETACKPVPETTVRVRMHLADYPAAVAPSNPRNDIQRPRVTVQQAVDLVAGFAELGVSEMIIDVPPGRHVYMEQLRTVTNDVLPAALPRRSTPKERD
ncbi:TIGR03619 family F420-dependent LLM class oxidoreductase [Nocardia vinacea]|uniref:TIGR03619 family F420-dependent LLM class oxidoreductase n=1 Tax=Nocardia vinacea TaxID=96468 RepID=A0ABZ1YTM5_9NOCA|nr:TIGR03619 family F420-dependent LLM class oxidoreductase [Nocardia vinacea]